MRRSILAVLFMAMLVPSTPALPMQNSELSVTGVRSGVDYLAGGEPQTLPANEWVQVAYVPTSGAGWADLRVEYWQEACPCRSFSMLLVESTPRLMPPALPGEHLVRFHLRESSGRTAEHAVIVGGEAARDERERFIEVEGSWLSLDVRASGNDHRFFGAFTGYLATSDTPTSWLTEIELADWSIVSYALGYGAGEVRLEGASPGAQIAIGPPLPKLPTSWSTYVSSGYSGYLTEQQSSMSLRYGRVGADPTRYTGMLFFSLNDSFDIRHIGGGRMHAASDREFEGVRAETKLIAAHTSGLSTAAEFSSASFVMAKAVGGPVVSAEARIEHEARQEISLSGNARLFAEGDCSGAWRAEVRGAAVGSSQVTIVALEDFSPSDHFRTAFGVDGSWC